MTANTTSVSVQYCPEYDPVKVGAAIRKALQESANTKKIKPGERVFVKVNHLPPASAPERGIVTHPVFVEEVLKVLLDLGAKVTFGDDVEACGDPFAVSGIAGVSKRLGVKLVNFKKRGFVKVAIPDGDILKTAHVAKDILEADAIVSLPKVKTHGFTLLTGALKNMFGVIPQGERIDFHRNYADPKTFSRALVDLYCAYPPRLCIADGIMAMEGNGPATGQTRALGAVLAGEDAVAVDAVMGLLINLQPHHIHTCRIAGERGIGICDPRQIEILGNGLDLAISDFLLPATSIALIRKAMPPFLYGWLFDKFSRVELVVDSEKCANCQACLPVCPTGAMLTGQDVMRIDDEKCIQCFCCQEACRYSAVVTRERLMGKIIKQAVYIIRGR